MSPYFSRSASRIGPSEGYFSFVRTTLFRSTASMGGLADSPVTSVSPSCISGCRTDGFQSTSAFPVVSPRTTVSRESYAKGLDFPSNDTVALTENGTVAPVAAPGVIFTPVRCASSW